MIVEAIVRREKVSFPINEKFTIECFYTIITSLFCFVELSDYWPAKNVVAYLLEGIEDTTAGHGKVSFLVKKRSLVYERIWTFYKIIL